MGGNIAKVNSENSIVFDMYYFYWDIKTTPKKLIMENELITSKLRKQKEELVEKFKNGDYKGYFDEAKKVMRKWGVLEKKEKVEQHNLAIQNKYGLSDYTIIDLEYQVSDKSEFVYKNPSNEDLKKKPRFDIIAVNKKGELCVIELKKGLGAVRGIKAGVVDHWDSYEYSIKQNQKPFVKEMKNILKQKQEFKLIDNNVKITKEEPKFMFAYAYSNDENGNIKPDKSIQDKSYNVEIHKIKAKVETIFIQKGSFKLLDKWK